MPYGSGVDPAHLGSRRASCRVSEEDTYKHGKLRSLVWEAGQGSQGLWGMLPQVGTKLEMGIEIREAGSFE